jgi:methyl-accepting chemotaxis protein
MNKSSLASKLYISFIIMFLLILSAAIYCVAMNNKTQYYANDVATNWFPSVNAHGNLLFEFSNITRRELIIITSYLEGNLSTVKKDKEELLQWDANFFEKLEKYKKELMTVGMEEATTEEVYRAWKVYKEDMDKDLELVEKNPVEAYRHFTSNTRKSALPLAEALRKEVEFNYSHGVEASKQGDYFTEITDITMLGMVIFSLIVAITVFQIIRKSTNSIANSVVNLKSQSIATTKIASSLKLGSESLSSSVSEQASSVHETSAAINQITSMVNRTAENTKESTNVAMAASEIAEQGQKIMQRLGVAMETIQESSSQLQNIAVIINQINTKTAVINDIVSKTELLSLNASIESARAGEYGKGFAVVAEEVGNLAKVSGKAAHEIQELITSSQEQVNTILKLTKERVVEGKNVTGEAQASFLQITENISNLSNVIQQISEATREQEIGVRQIATAMSQIDRATQNSQASVGITSESAKSLVEQSSKLDTVAKEIELLVNGKIVS